MFLPTGEMIEGEMSEGHNATPPGPSQGVGAAEMEKSPCVLGVIPLVYYSVLLCLGLPEVNVLNTVVLSSLAAKTKKSSYCYLLALSASDLLTQFFIVFVGFILEAGLLARELPEAMAHSVSVMEFAANHASIWITVPLTVDRYYALCHPLRYRAVSYPGRTYKVIATVFVASLLTGVPFYWWSDLWRVRSPPTPLDQVLVWTHCFIIYFVPCTVFLVVNSIIVHKLGRRRAPSGRSGKTTAILLAVTTVFAILWAPRTVVIIYHLYVSSVNRDWKVHLAFDLANMLAMTNTAVNFFLYCFVSKRFRVTVKEVVRSFCKR
ncbi:probable G-protein coupled receptor 142 [Callorhinchus milii]|uniref:probable G-protein coupled receptor 142 n=1 Tax=Callorhinchus milii TaxID=7868 RepID=UPI001C3FD90A|nr:probable G-protein coupled receptor 142 [Callorhinchus milii]